MKRIALSAAILVAVAIGGYALQAHAYYCNTTCSNIGNQRMCNTYCN